VKQKALKYFFFLKCFTLNMFLVNVLNEAAFQKKKIILFLFLSGWFINIVFFYNLVLFYFILTTCISQNPKTIIFNLINWLVLWETMKKIKKKLNVWFLGKINPLKTLIFLKHTFFSCLWQEVKSTKKKLINLKFILNQ
jgi:hypothetical protein